MSWTNHWRYGLDETRQSWIYNTTELYKGHRLFSHARLWTYLDQSSYLRPYAEERSARWNIHSQLPEAGS